MRCGGGGDEEVPKERCERAERGSTSDVQGLEDRPHRICNPALSPPPPPPSPAAAPRGSDTVFSRSLYCAWLLNCYPQAMSAPAANGTRWLVVGTCLILRRCEEQGGTVVRGRGRQPDRKKKRERAEVRQA
jgi:hypothetical protein